MAAFTPEEIHLLDAVQGSKAPFLSRKTVNSLLALFAKREQLAQQDRFEAAALQMAGFGVTTPDEIRADARLSETLRQDCLRMRAQYDAARLHAATLSPATNGH